MAEELKMCCADHLHLFTILHYEETGDRDVPLFFVHPGYLKPDDAEGLKICIRSNLFEYH